MHIIYGLLFLVYIHSIKALQATFKVNELWNFLDCEFRMLVPMFLRDVEIAAQFVGIIKGDFPVFAMEIMGSCPYWSKETYSIVRKYTRHDTRLQTFLLSPQCAALLPFTPDDLIISKHDHTALPYSTISSASELVTVLNALPEADPLGWYRSVFVPNFWPLFFEACMQAFQQLLTVDINIYISSAPPLAKVPAVAAHQWVELLTFHIKFGTDAQRASIFFYIHKHLDNNREEAIFEWLNELISNILLQWAGLVQSNDPMTKFLKFLTARVDNEEADTFKSLNAIGINETSPVELIHLAIYLEIRAFPNSPLLKKLGQMIRSRSRLLVNYSSIDLINLLSHLYEACSGPFLETCRHTARKVLGSHLRQRVVGEAFLSYEMHILLFPLSAVESIIYHRKWFRWLPSSEWKGDTTNEMDMVRLLRKHWTTPPRNAPGVNLQMELRKMVNSLLKHQLVDVVVEKPNSREFCILNDGKNQTSGLELFILYQTYLLLHFDDIQRPRTLIYSRNLALSFIRRQVKKFSENRNELWAGIIAAFLLRIVYSFTPPFTSK